MDIAKRIKKEVINDYFTANIKAEVILDMLLTPVIGEIVTVGCMCMKEDNPVDISKVMKEENAEKSMGPEGAIHLITKEFPVLNIEKTDDVKGKPEYRAYGKLEEGNEEILWVRKWTEAGNPTFYTHNIDYLMHDSKYIYFAELKTDLESINDAQCKRYQKDMERLGAARFDQTLGKEFMELLAHVFSIKSQKENEDARNNYWVNMKNLFHEIEKENLMSKTEEAEQREQSIYYTDRLRNYALQQSQKYLFTAARMLDHKEDIRCREIEDTGEGKYGGWWENLIKEQMIYIVPEVPKRSAKTTGNSIYIPLSKMISDEGIKRVADEIKQRTTDETEVRDKIQYWLWLAGVLGECFRIENNLNAASQSIGTDRYSMEK